jgi:hypothetical protein
MCDISPSCPLHRSTELRLYEGTTSVAVYRYNSHNLTSANILILMFRSNHKILCLQPPQTDTSAARQHKMQCIGITPCSVLKLSIYCHISMLQRDLAFR